MSRFAYSPTRPEFAFLAKILGEDLPDPLPKDSDVGVALLRNMLARAASEKPYLLTLLSGRRALAGTLQWSGHECPIKIDPSGMPSGSSRDVEVLSELAVFMAMPFESKEGVKYKSRWEGWDPARGGLSSYAHQWFQRGLQNSTKTGVLSSQVKPYVSVSTDASGKTRQRWHYAKVMSLDALQEKGVSVTSDRRFVTTREPSLDSDGDDAFEEVFDEVIPDQQPVEAVPDDVDFPLDPPAPPSTVPSQMESVEHFTLPTKDTKKEEQLLLAEWLFDSLTGFVPEDVLETAPNLDAQLVQQSVWKKRQHFWKRRNDPSVLPFATRPEFLFARHITGTPSLTEEGRYEQLERLKHVLSKEILAKARKNHGPDFAAAAVDFHEFSQWLVETLNNWDPRKELISSHLLSSLRLRLSQRVEQDEDFSMQSMG